jgi:hypothetical protein
MISRAPDHREGQHRTAFTDILELLVDASVGRIAAVLVDQEGEAVDHAGRMPAFEAKLAGAHWQIVLREACEAARKVGAAAVGVRSISIRTERLGYLVLALEDGYVLVVVCTDLGAMNVSQRALREVEIELSREAGLALRDPSAPQWYGVRVRTEPAAGPTTIEVPGTGRERIETSEKLVAAGDFERAYRVRTEAGRLLELVREPSGHWYACACSETS